MIVNAPPSAACPPYLNGMTCSVMLGSPTASISRSICAASTFGPPIGRRSAASSTIAHSLGGLSLPNSFCRPIRSATRRSTSSGSRPGAPCSTTARAYSSVCSRPGTNCIS